MQPATGKLTVLSTTSSLGSYITAAAGANEYPLVLGSNSVTSITGMKDGVIMVEAGEGDRAIVFQPQALANNYLASFNEVFSQLKTEHHQGTGAIYHHVPLCVNQGSRWIDVDALEGTSAEGTQNPSFPGYTNGFVTSGMFQGQGIFMMSAINETTSLTIEAEVVYHVIVTSVGSPFAYVANTSTGTTPVPPVFHAAGTGSTAKGAIVDSLNRAATHPSSSPAQALAANMAARNLNGIQATNTDSTILHPSVVAADPHSGSTTASAVGQELGVVASIASLYQNRGAIAKGASTAWGALKSGLSFLGRGAATVGRYAAMEAPLVEEVGAGALMVI